MDSLPLDTGRRGLRRLLVQAHRWLGLTLGAFFVMTSITGSTLVFYEGIDSLLNPELRRSPDGARPASYESLYEALSARWPESEGYWSIEIPRQGGTITSRFYREAAPERSAERRIVSMDPTTFEVLRDVPWGDYLMTWIYNLHQQLLLPPPAGRTVMGAVGLTLLAFLGTGIAVWWPVQRSWRRALSLSRRASMPRRLLEIHQLCGVFAWPLLIVAVATGAMICLPAQVRGVLTQISPVESPPVVRSAAGLGAARISVDEAMRQAKARFPAARIVWVDVPNTPAGVYQVRMQQPEEPSARFPRTYVWIDQFTGAVLAARSPRGESAGDSVLTWLHPLHAGEAFGLAGRVAVFVLGLVPLLLFITGLLRWMHRRRTRRAPADAVPSARPGGPRN